MSARTEEFDVLAMQAAMKAGIQPGDDINYRRSQLCTEVQAARVFTNLFGPYVRWVPEWGWVFWDNKRWRRDSEKKVYAMASEVGGWFRVKGKKLVAKGEDERLVKWVLEFARKMESARGMDDFLKIAQPGLCAPADSFDTEPLKVTFRNCTLDFARISGELPHHYDHSSADFITKVIPHDWSMGAPCPRWTAFLERILPCENLRAYVKRAVGYSIMGTTREQCFFVCHGDGQNGKSTFLNTIRFVLGKDYAIQADPRSFMAGRNDAIRNDLADFRGIRFVSAIETGDDKRLDEAMIKAMTGGEDLRCRFLYHESFQYQPEFKLWLCTNHKPSIRGTDLAIWRRVRLIPFTVTIPDDRQDRSLDKKLRGEVDGILDWIVQGAVEYLQKGLQTPEAVKTATAQYRSTEDIIGRFLCERTVAAAGAQTAAGELYAAYKSWAEEGGEYVVSSTRLGKNLGERGFDSYRGAGGKRSWLGLRLEAGSDE